MNKDLPPHHKPDGGFQNPGDVRESGLFDVLRWVAQRDYFTSDRDPSAYNFTVLENDGVELQKTKDLQVTWVGHATTLVQMGGVNILTDPIWSERCSPVAFAGPKRYTKPGIDFTKLPEIDIVIISHNHYDHMDLPTLKDLQQKYKPKFFVGLGNKRMLENEGLTNVTELDWWQTVEISEKQIQLHFTPTQHFSGRGALDRDETLWGSFVLERNGKRVYFAGDTAYFDGFKKIQERFGKIDLAILPIGAYEPRWFMSPVHVNPEEAIRAFVDLKAEYMLPMHFQTFVLSDEKLDAPLKEAKQALSDVKSVKGKLLELKIGETWVSP